MFFYYIPLIQISGIFFTALMYFVVLVFMRPYESKKDFFLALMSELITTLVNFFFFVLTLDESYNLVTVDTRVQIGWFIIVLIILKILKSTLLVVYPAIRGITKLFARKSKPDDKDSGDESEAPVGKKEVELVLKPGTGSKESPAKPELETSILNTSARRVN